MALKVGELYVDLGLHDQGFQSGLNKADRSATQFGRSLMGLTGLTGGMPGQLGQVGESAAELGGKTGMTALAFGATTAAVAAAAYGTFKFGAACIQAAGQAEQLKVAFTTILHGNAGAADELMGKLQNMADQTNYTMADLAPLAQKMMAFGFSARQVIPNLTAIGDAVASMGGTPEMMERVTIALGQMKTKGKASGEEMLQLAENNINAYQYLAEALGTDVNGAMAKVTKGAVDADTAVKAVLAGMRRDFGGGMEKQSHTIFGMWSTITDKMQGFFREIGKSMMPTLKPIIDMIGRAVSALPSIASKIGRVFEAWGPALMQVIDAWRTAFTGLLPGAKKASDTWVDALVKAGQGAAILLEKLQPILVIWFKIQVFMSMVAAALLVIAASTSPLALIGFAAAMTVTKKLTAGIAEDLKAANKALDKKLAGDQLKAAAEAEVKSVLGVVEAQRKAREEQRKRMMEAIGFTSLSDIWQRAQVAGMRNQYGPPAVSEVTTANLPNARTLNDIRDSLKRQEQQQKQLVDLARTRLGVYQGA